MALLIFFLFFLAFVLGVAASEFRITDTLGSLFVRVFNNGNVSMLKNLEVIENITAKNYMNGSGVIEWIAPTQIADVDKEDVETDLNTFVDIGGDSMSGDFNVSGIINASAIRSKGDFNLTDSASCVILQNGYKACGNTTCMNFHRSNGSIFLSGCD